MGKEATQKVMLSSSPFENLFTDDELLFWKVWWEKSICFLQKKGHFV